MTNAFATRTVDYAYRDASLPIAERVENLLAQMTLGEKAGLFFQTMIMIGEGGALAEANPVFDIPSTEELVIGRQMTHFNLFGTTPSAARMAAWHNRLQELAASTRLGIPVTLSTDPCHSFTVGSRTTPAGPFSQWPDPLGFGAIGDEALVEKFGDMARQEYTAVGLRVALHPQVDLATEPRWARQSGTFGEDAALTSRLGVAYIRGFQGATLGPDSVATMTKHFPGGGPQQDGRDPHFANGRSQVYPGSNFEYHLKPFEAAFEAGASQVMPYYGMPIGTEHEEIGFNFNRSIITGLLRERFGFDGIVCSDWGLLTETVTVGEPYPARAWGVEQLSPRERMLRILDAGVDQFGGESIPDLLVELVRSGEISEERVDVSARRVLREKFVLGLFDEPFLDVTRAAAVVGSAEFRAAGAAAQRAAITLLVNGRSAPILPLASGLRVYLQGVDPTAASEYATVVETPDEADVAIVRIRAPFEERYTVFATDYHAGSLDFPREQAAELVTLARTVPTIVDVYLDRPAILTPFAREVDALLVDFGASDRAVLDVVFGAASPQGSLPIELPSSMDAVRASRPDVPSDTEHPLFRFGHGLRYPAA
jgi:beta-glucosidase